MLLKFKEWDNQNLNEKDSGMDKIVNWLSSNFGGSVSKIDNLLSDVNSIETQYSKDWNEIQTDIDSLELKRAQTKSDPAEAKKLERMIDRNQRLLNALEKKRKADLSKINSKLDSVVKNNKRLISYWNLEKAKLETELAEKMYKMAKDLTDPTIADELYSKYQKASMEAKEKDQKFREKFGKFDFAKPIKTKSPLSDLSDPDFGTSLANILAMDAPEFTKFVSRMDSDKVKSLIRLMQSERNERYALLDTERDKIEASSGKDASAEKGFSDFTKSSMREIRDIRTKITIAKRYV